MLDSISESRLSAVNPELARRIRQLAELLSFPIRVTQGYRTWAEQDALYAQGRTTPGNIVTNAQGGYSAHNFGLAVDLVPMIDGQPDWNNRDAKWQELLAKGKSVGLAEGAEWRTFPDAPHFYLEGTPANPDDNMRTLFADGGIQAVWNQFDLTESV
jgi:peptidoglycan LD-endopeptidase CwlK